MRKASLAGISKNKGAGSTNNVDNLSTFRAREMELPSKGLV
jgi:hypothetical protein